MSAFALGVLGFARSGATEVGLLRVARVLPFLLATLPLGLLVDRRRGYRLSLMVGADLGRFALVAAIPITAWIGIATMELLYGVVFAAGVLTVLYQLADFAFLPSVVDHAHLVDANGKIAASQSANEVGGRGLGGLLIEAISAPVAVAVNAVAFLVSALSLRRIEASRVEDEAAAAGPPRGPARREVTAGLRIAVRDRYVRPLLGEATTFNAFNEMFVLGLLIYSVRELGLGLIT